MIDLPRNRTLSLLGSAIALSVALIVLFAGCAIVAAVAPDLRFAHAWIGLFTAAPMNSPQAWLEGLFFSLVLGAVAGSVFAAVHNAVAARGL
jgi:hypothetical protein